MSETYILRESSAKTYTVAQPASAAATVTRLVDQRAAQVAPIVRQSTPAINVTRVTGPAGPSGPIGPAGITDLNSVATPVGPHTGNAVPGFGYVSVVLGVKQTLDGPYEFHTDGGLFVDTLVRSSDALIKSPVEYDDNLIQGDYPDVSLLILKTAPAQTALPFQVKNSADQDIAHIGPDGVLRVAGVTTYANDSGTAAVGAIGSAGSDIASFRTADSSLAQVVDEEGMQSLYRGGFVENDSSVNAVPLMVKPSVSQTSASQSWLNSAGTEVATVDPAGRAAFTDVSAGKMALSQKINVGNNTYLPGIQTSDLSPMAINSPIAAGANDRVALRVQGNTNEEQTAPLQTWENPDGGMRAGIAPDGALVNTAGMRFGSLTHNYHGVFLPGGTQGPRLTGYGTSALAVQNQEIIRAVAEDGYINQVHFMAPVRGGDGRQQAVPTAVPLVVMGATAQSANLSEWKGSDGSVKASVDANGYFSTTVLKTPNLVSNYFYQQREDGIPNMSIEDQRTKFYNYLEPTAMMGSGHTNGAANYFTIREGGSYIPLAVRNGTDSTTDIQQWWKGDNTVLAKVTSTGDVSFASGKIMSTAGRIYIDASEKPLALMNRFEAALSASARLADGTSIIAHGHADSNGQTSALRVMKSATYGSQNSSVETASITHMGQGFFSRQVQVTGQVGQNDFLLKLRNSAGDPMYEVGYNGEIQTRNNVWYRSTPDYQLRQNYQQDGMTEFASPAGYAFLNPDNSTALTVAQGNLDVKSGARIRGTLSVDSVIRIAEGSSKPGYLENSAGALRWVGGDGTVTTIAPA